MEKQLSFLNDQILKDINKKDKEFWEIYIDGAARGNPGPAGAGVIIMCNKSIQHKESFFLGIKTNNQAEYLALVISLFTLKKLINDQKIEKNITIYSDSELLVSQMTGVYKTKNTWLLRIKTLVQEILTELDLSYKFVHIERIKNSIADRLANEGIDKNVRLSEELSSFFVQHDISIGCS